MGDTRLSNSARYEQFRATKTFGSLQQIRTLSVLFVLAAHMHDDMWRGMHGELGVAAFFVVSGFIITTLLLREEERAGRASLAAFYIRRSFRILPLYLLVLATFAALILGLGLGGQVGEFTSNLPYYLTYQNDFAPAGPFGHSWSLAVEEKFYLVWPLLGFTSLALTRRRGLIVAALLAVCLAAQFTPLSYLAIYVPILAGVAVAVAMHSRRGFASLNAVMHPAPTMALLAAAGVVGFLEPAGKVHSASAVLFALALPGILTATARTASVWSARPLVWAGGLTYAVYLIHPLVKSAIDEMIAQDGASGVEQAVRFIGTVVVSFAGAWVLARWFENPFIALGRRVSARFDGTQSIPTQVAAPAAPVTVHTYSR